MENTAPVLVITCAAIAREVNEIKKLGAWAQMDLQAITADLHAYPMLRYFVETPEGEALLDGHPRLARWLRQMQQRPSVRATSFHWPSDSTDGF